MAQAIRLHDLYCIIAICETLCRLSPITSPQQHLKRVLYFYLKSNQNSLFVLESWREFILS
jgi:hypothetical protein